MIGKKQRQIFREEAEQLFAVYQRTRSFTVTARECGRSPGAVHVALARFGFIQIQRAPRLTAELVAAMRAEYEAGLSLNALGRKYGRTRHSVREAFLRRGMSVRSVRTTFCRDTRGRIAAAQPFTESQIEELIASARKLAVPVALKHEWRKWAMERRGEFIARLRARLSSPDDPPALPFSRNVEPFDYASPRAWKIVERMNRGLGARGAAVKLNISSQGVIWNDQLWFWAAGTGYQCGPWNPETGRPSLHHVIWEKVHGRKVPPSHVLRFRDGNPNNLEPENLILATRNELARENQAAALFKKSRELTGLLLGRAKNRKEKTDGCLEQIRGRKHRGGQSQKAA